MNYDAVIFDLDQTLINLSPRFVDALLECVRVHNIIISVAHSRQAELWIHQYWAKHPRNAPSQETFGQHCIMPLLAEIGRSIDRATAEAIANCFAVQDLPIQFLMPGVKETLGTLKQRGLIVGILSNRETDAEKDLHLLAIADLVDFSLTAGQVGIWKPHRELFRAALQCADNLNPNTTLYVGDNYYVDILGARGAGIDGLLVDYQGIYRDSNIDCSVIHRLEDLLVFI